MTGGPQSWKGETEALLEPARHRWQAGAGSLERNLIRSQERNVRIRLATLVGVSLFMLALFVALLLYVPSKTPVITVATTAYSWPLPPNAWAQEDVLGFGSLDGKTLQWHDASGAWQSRSTALDDLRLRLRGSAALAARSKSLVLYISMHGAVDDKGQPCLIPPSSTPLAPHQWIRMDELASVVASQVPRQSHVLIVLDCVDQQCNWNAAIVQSTFAERVENWVESRLVDNLSWLLSASAQQQAWSGPELRGSIFGKEFRLGLAGAADDPQWNALPQRENGTSNVRSGNGDGQVSLFELANYVQQRVSAWSEEHRATAQTPRLLTRLTSDISLARGLRRREVARQIEAGQFSELAPAAPSADELSQLWRMLEQLRTSQAFRYDPRGWVDLEHQLIWLQQLSMAGRAYHEQATQKLYPELAKRLQECVQRSSRLLNNPSLVAQAQLLSDAPSITIDRDLLPSLAWIELATKNEAGDTTPVRTSLPPLCESDDPQAYQALLASGPWTAGQSVPGEVNFAGLVHALRCRELWPDRTWMRQALELRDRCENLAVIGDVRGHRWRRASIAELDRTRRTVEDQLFIGPEPGYISAWERLQKATDPTTGDAVKARDQIDQALGIRDRGLAEVPYLAAWVCAPHTDMTNLGEWLTRDASQPVEEASAASEFENRADVDPLLRQRMAIQRLLRWIGNLHALGEMVGRAPASGQVDFAKLAEVVTTASRDQQAMTHLLNDHIRRALVQSDAHVASIGAITALLDVPFLTVDDRQALRKKLDQHFSHALAQTASAASMNAKQLSEAGSPGERIELDRSRDPQAEGAEASKIGKGRYSDRLRDWPLHPLAAILKLGAGRLSLSLENAQDVGAVDSGPGEATTGSPRVASGSVSGSDGATRELNAIDAANQTLRNHYLSIVSFNARQLSAWIEDVKLDVDDQWITDPWSQCAFAAHLERASLPLSPLRSESDAVAMFLGLALKDQMLWYAWRTLDDFYAAAGTSAVRATSIASMPGNKPYFETAVDQILKATAVLPEDADSLTLEQSLVQRAEFLRVLARSGIKPTIKAGVPNPSSGRVTYELTVASPLSQVGPGDSPTFTWPVGAAVASIDSPQSQVLGSRCTIAMPLASSGTTCVIDAPPLDRSSQHDVVVLFRGHQFRTPLFVGSGIVVDFQPNDVDWAEVVLFGDRMRQPSIVFVLDCSWSMGDPIPIEAIDSPTQSRLELAKVQILRLIEQLAASGDARLGVRLFGHRLGWSRPVNPQTGAPTGSTQILVQPDYPRSIPDDIVPSRDVEAVIPLGRFTPEMTGGLSKLLSGVVPWGQSPLYLSIIESLKDFGADEVATTKSIVIITDGDNFQFNAGRRPGGDGGNATTMEDVLRAWQTNKIPLYILGVGISESDSALAASSAAPSTSAPTAAQARATLKQLAEQTGGKYYDIENGNDLLRALSEQLSTATYTVSPMTTSAAARSGLTIGTDAAGAQEAQLNSPVKLERLKRPGQRFEVSFGSVTKAIELQGGESLEMVVRDDGQDIESQPFDRQSPKAGTLTRAGSDQRLMARVHRPIVQPSGITFPVSIQDPAAHYTPRPTETWIEITPIAADNMAMRRSYLFYDTNYDLKTPVPMQSWLATDWPTAAAAADVRVWLRYDQTPVLQSIPLAQLKRESARWSSGVSLGGVEDVSLRIVMHSPSSSGNSFQLHVTEIHGEQSRGVGTLRIGLDSAGGPVARRITRRFDADSRLAIHTFEFDASQGVELFDLDAARLVITTRQSVLENAWQLRGGAPIRVELSQPAELLP